MASSTVSCDIERKGIIRSPSDYNHIINFCAYIIIITSFWLKLHLPKFEIQHLEMDIEDYRADNGHVWKEDSREA